MAGQPSPDFSALLAEARASMGTNPDNPMVYMGRSFSPDAPGKLRTGPTFPGAEPAGNPTRVTADVAKSKWLLMSDMERIALAQRMARAGILSNPSDYNRAQEAWFYAVEQAAGFTSLGKEVTPWDFLDIAEAVKNGNSRGSGPKRQTATSTRVNLPSREDAEAVVTQILKEALGRDPDKGELSRYSSLLMGKAQANPEKTTTTTTYNADGTSSNSSTVSSGGYSAAAMQQDVMDKAKADKEYGAYQAATTYFSALMSAIDSPV